MNATPKTLALQVRNAKAQKAEQERLSHMAGTRLSFTSETGVVRPKKRVVQDVYEDFCFICGRATDHVGEHNDVENVEYDTDTREYVVETQYEIIVTRMHFAYAGVRIN
jgi:hypothetical protein